MRSENKPAPEKQEELTLVYAQEDLPDVDFSASIFLMGSLAKNEPSWYEEAIELLRAAGYRGVVFVPVDRVYGGHYKLDNLDWEERCQQMADRILCRTPDGELKLPDSLTADVWGGWKRSGKIVLCSPEGGWNGAYQRCFARMLRVPVAATLAEAVRLTLDKIGDGAKRSGGEREVPLHIWRTPSFQYWYAQLKAAGNRLEHAYEVKTVWARQGTQVFMWELHVDIFVTAENRHKANEIVIGRPSTSSVMLYRRREDSAHPINDLEWVSVREFRSAVATNDGWVRELPGGSDFATDLSWLDIAVMEVFDETGLQIDPSRFVYHGARQALATMSAHQAHLFSVELTAEEMAYAKLHEELKTVFGDGEERTYIEVVTVGEVLANSAYDRSTVSMVLEVALGL